MHKSLLFNYFNINIKKIKEYNDILIKKFNIIGTFSDQELITIYIGITYYNLFTLSDVQNYLLNGKVLINSDITYGLHGLSGNNACIKIKKELSKKQELIKNYVNDFSQLILNKQLHIRYNMQLFRT